MAVTIVDSFRSYMAMRGENQMRVACGAIDTADNEIDTTNDLCIFIDRLGKRHNCQRAQRKATPRRFVKRQVATTNKEPQEHEVATTEEES